MSWPCLEEELGRREMEIGRLDGRQVQLSRCKAAVIGKIMKDRSERHWEGNNDRTW